MELIKLYFIGLMILIVAIMANYLAAQLGLKTWYDFLNQLGNGSALNFKEALWLFVAYPLILGASNFIGNVLFNFFSLWYYIVKLKAIPEINKASVKVLMGKAVLFLAAYK